jgi:predicted amidohydrolase
MAPGGGGPELHVAAVQMHSGRDLRQNLEKILAHVRTLGAQGVQAAALPECALPGYYKDTLTTVDPGALEKAEAEIRAACREASLSLVLGTCTPLAGTLYNSASVIDAQGNEIERYHKVQLAGEEWFTPGDHLPLFALAQVPSSVIICHDSRYPELVRLPVLAGARVVYYISNESGVKYEHKVGPYRAQVQARAVENTVYVVQANAPVDPDVPYGGSHGQSRIVAPDGNIVAEASLFAEEVVSATIDLSRASGNLGTRSLRSDLLRAWWEQGRSLVVDRRPKSP